MNAIHFSGIFSAIAKGVKGKRGVDNLKRDQRFNELITTTCDRLNTEPEWFDVQALSNVTHSLGKLGIKHDEFYALIVWQSGRIARDGKTQELNNIVWSFATNRFKSNDLFEAVATQSGRIAKDDNLQGLSNIVWSFATNRFKSNDLFEAVAT